MNKHVAQVLLAGSVVLSGVLLRQMSLAIGSPNRENLRVGVFGVAPLPPSSADQSARASAGKISWVPLPGTRTEEPKTEEPKLVAVGTSPVPLPPPGTRTEEPKLVAVGTSPVPLPPPGTRTEEPKLVAVGTSPVPLPPPGTRTEGPKLVAVGTSPVPLPPPGTRTEGPKLVAVGTSPVQLPPPGIWSDPSRVPLRTT